MTRQLRLVAATALAIASVAFSQTVNSISPTSAPAGIGGPVTVTINCQNSGRPDTASRLVCTGA